VARPYTATRTGCVTLVDVSKAVQIVQAMGGKWLCSALQLIAGGSTPTVLRPTGAVTLPDDGAGLTVDDAAKRRVDKFLGE
jgi:hypothetical protein